MTMCASKIRCLHCTIKDLELRLKVLHKWQRERSYLDEDLNKEVLRNENLLKGFLNEESERRTLQRYSSVERTTT